MNEGQQEAAADQQLERRERLRALAGRYWVEIQERVEDCQSSSEEDILLYLSGDEHLDGWVAVTAGSGRDGIIHYLKAFRTRSAAEAYTVANVTDDIFIETPVAVVELDSDLEPWGAVFPVVAVEARFSTEPVASARG